MSFKVPPGFECFLTRDTIVDLAGFKVSRPENEHLISCCAKHFDLDNTFDLVDKDDTFKSVDTNDEFDKVDTKDTDIN